MEHAGIEPTTEPDATRPNLAPIFVEELKIRHFRGLSAVDLTLEPGLTVLVGRNNSGKSRVLRAAGVGLGALPAELDDLTVGDAIESEATIDVVVAPLLDADLDDDEQAFADDVARVFKPDVVRLEPFQQRVAWRATIRRSAEGNGARAELHRLVYREGEGWALPSSPVPLSAQQRRLVAAVLISTGRDLSDEMTMPRSAIRRVLSDLEVSDEQRADIEARLAGLGREIVTASASLRAVQDALEQAEARVGSLGAPQVNPVPPRLEEVARSVSIELDTGTGSLPMRLHGAGPRSLASLQVHRVLYERRLGNDGPDRRPHPVTLIEEPEAHLHPQMQFELDALISSLPGQVVVTTHSAHLVTVVHSDALRLIRTDGATTQIRTLHAAPAGDDDAPRARRPEMHAGEMEKLKRLIERPFGELLFASAVVVGDGATERAFLPPLIRKVLGGLAHGVCVVDPGSMNQPVAGIVIKFAELVGIPWYLFADSDGQGRAAVASILDRHGAADRWNQPRVVWTDEGNGLATERMMVDFYLDVCRAALRLLNREPNDGATASDFVAALKDTKGSVGASLAHELIRLHPDHTTWPMPIRTLIERLGRALGPPEDDGNGD